MTGGTEAELFFQELEEEQELRTVAEAPSQELQPYPSVETAFIKGGGASSMRYRITES